MIATNMQVFSNELEQRYQAVWSAYGIPPRLAGATFQLYRPTCPEQERALQKCQAYTANGLDNIARGQGLFLQGSVGTGKSHLSVATLRTMVENQVQFFGRPASTSAFVDEPVYTGHYCTMVSVVDLLGMVRESFGTAQSKAAAPRLLHRCRTDALVILDDIGAEKPSEWVEEQLFALIDLRYRMQRSTIFTTNCSMKQLENQIGGRSVSRIIEMCEGVRVGGEDWRKR